MEKILKSLKESAIEQITNEKRFDLDAKYLFAHGRNWTRREIAEEIEKETEIGLNWLTGLVRLTIDLLERGKEKLDGVDFEE